MKTIKAFLDLVGTMYRRSKYIVEANQFIQ
jgi:hypothetical protein